MDPRNQNVQSGQPGYNANLQPGQPGYQAPTAQNQSFLAKVENTLLPGGSKSGQQAASALENQPGYVGNLQSSQPGYNSNMQSGQPGYSSTMQSGQPGYSSTMHSGQPGYSSTMHSGQPGYSSTMQPVQPGYSSNLQSGQPGFNSNLQSGQPGFNSNLQSSQPGYNSNLQPGQPGYQPPGQGVAQTISQSVHHAFGQSPMPGDKGYVTGQQSGQPGYAPGQSAGYSSSSSSQPGMMPAGYASFGPPSNVGYGRPTVLPTPNFNPNFEAERIRSAVKGAGTSESTIIDIFGSRTSLELKQIDACYKTMFGSMMMKDLESELKLSGSFMKILNYRFFTLAEFDAHNVHKSVTGPRTDENALIETFVTRNNQQIREAIEAYRRLFNKDMEKDVIGDTSGNFKNLMTSLIQGNRDESGRIDQNAAVADANMMYNAGQGRWGTDDLTLNNIFATRSFPQLALIFNEYSRISKFDIEQAIDKELSGNLKLAMIAIIKSARDRSGFFAERLYNALKGSGTDERTLNRIIVSRCEIDLEDIKQAFNVKFNKDLNKAIEGDTKGEYQKVLLQILGNYRTTPVY